ncbi:GTP pyrophosphokinase family protein [Prescottella agglutinans]|uniref:PpGpp synthetase/RelA/SpoT-type nucleotidyltransferase n=1 Tax=Prescottella agglutinans TaxID=1644129 RepID=A0ABT6ME35_9NOCA|nr:GTP pyrophosphokinase family protein [Prescottella agglutinans]MDH6282586.1 ppGpp synthetase/RelA/SpoT-type nucleotidyltransferase [Prescottella agglutinans]
MDLNEPLPWSRRMLRRLGEALAAGTEPPADCPSYDEVMYWHNDLAAEVAATMVVTDWVTADPVSFDLAARPKTVDTLVQKLRRRPPHLSLDQVQDLAGVRVDADFTLDTQLALAEEVASFFGRESIVKDIREKPHSGYRAVHVWVRAPAGRAEIQIRTTAQSAWANTYERLGDKIGREIRYGEIPENPDLRTVVEHLHEISEEITKVENLEQTLADANAKLRSVPDCDRTDDHVARVRQIAEIEHDVKRSRTGYVGLLLDLKRTLDDMEDA